MTLAAVSGRKPPHLLHREKSDGGKRQAKQQAADHKAGEGGTEQAGRTMPSSLCEIAGGKQAAPVKGGPPGFSLPASAPTMMPTPKSGQKMIEPEPSRAAQRAQSPARRWP